MPNKPSFFPFFWEIWMQFLKIVCVFFLGNLYFFHKTMWFFDVGNIIFSFIWQSIQASYYLLYWDILIIPNFKNLIQNTIRDI